MRPPPTDPLGDASRRSARPMARPGIVEEGESKDKEKEGTKEPTKNYCQESTSDYNIYTLAVYHITNTPAVEGACSEGEVCFSAAQCRTSY
eukprot:1186195-Prorocentrum_minimum.AAC.3